MVFPISALFLHGLLFPQLVLMLLLVMYVMVLQLFSCTFSSAGGGCADFLDIKSIRTPHRIIETFNEFQNYIFVCEVPRYVYSLTLYVYISCVVIVHDIFASHPVVFWEKVRIYFEKYFGNSMVENQTFSIVSQLYGRGEIFMSFPTNFTTWNRICNAIENKICLGYI